jgi:hypothetical protein
MKVIEVEFFSLAEIARRHDLGIGMDIKEKDVRGGRVVLYDILRLLVNMEIIGPVTYSWSGP